LVTGVYWEVFDYQKTRRLKFSMNSIGQTFFSFKLFSFLEGVETVVVGHRSNGESPQLIDIHNYKVSTMINNQVKNETLHFLYRVLHFLLTKVEKGGIYLFCRHYDQHMQKHGLYLYKVTDQYEEQLTFISHRILNQLGFS
jgi:hypothetical protein